MQVKSIAEYSKGEHSAILSTFIKLPFVINDIKIFLLSIFEWPFYTGFTVCFLFCVFSSVEGERSSLPSFSGLFHYHIPTNTWTLLMEDCAELRSRIGHSMLFHPVRTWPRGYKTFSILNSGEHEIYPAHKC